MNQKIIVFSAAYIVWCLFSWVPDTAHLLIGAFAAFIVAFMLGDVAIQRTHLLRHPRRYAYLLFWYIPIFLWEIVKANMDVAYRVIRPDLPIKPGIVKVKTSLQSATACTLLANSITLTPGTLSVDIDMDQSVLYIHWIDVTSTDVEAATRTIVDRFERILRNIFEEEQENEMG